MIANVHLQDNILNNSKNPIQDARTHAMLLYRTPQSINQRFNQKKATNNNFEIQNWLIYHGETLKNRFQLSAYKLMNHLLKTNNIEDGRDNIQNLISNSSTNIYLVSVDTDLFFTSDYNILTYNKFKKTKSNIYHHQIKSVHGHDAFLIEFKQLSQILNLIFQSQKLPYLI
jgi:homoserine O-acetyltransferase